MTLNNPMGAPRMSDGVCSCRCVATSNHGSGFNLSGSNSPQLCCVTNF